MKKMLASMVVVGMCQASLGVALPFNVDMYHNQKHTGDVARPKAEGSVPLGSLQRFVGANREDALKQENHLKGDLFSIANGERLFAVNCSPCHGSYAGAKHSPGVVSQWLPGPNLADGVYKDKPDVHFFQFIHFGGMALMPPQGYKLSLEEHWDIVNYIRKIQSLQ